MAHPTDTQSRITISNHPIHSMEWYKALDDARSVNAYHLALQFCRKHPYWPLDQITSHLLTIYEDFGMNKEIIKKAMCAYIDEREV